MVKPRSSAEATYIALRHRLLEGHYPAGFALRETELAEEFSTSRTPVREALRLLAAERLVEFEPNKGAKVAPWTGVDLRRIFGLRQRLEGYAAAKAADQISAGEIQKLERLCEEMEEANGQSPQRFQEIAVLNNTFHGIILEVGSDSRLVAIVADLVEISLVRQTFAHYDAEQLHRSFAHHRELVAAFRYKDSEWAESVMSAHIFSARAVLTGIADCLGEQAGAPKVSPVRVFE